MNLERYIQGVITIPRLMRYHGLSKKECPIHAFHYLTMLPDKKVAVCLECGMEWDVIGLHEILTGKTREEASKELYEMIQYFSPVSSGNEEMEESNPESKKKGGTAQSLNFWKWLDANRPHIWGLPEYDGNANDAVAFINLKGNLCLLPSAVEGLSIGELRTWIQGWKQEGLIRTPKDKLGLKRPQRIPSDIRLAQQLPDTMRVFVFHRQETMKLLAMKVITTTHSA
ncbi:hypothetical protein [Effusibacillus pohliae]|uniref:hypothetical protein n=1 Tax=Effusibacillus pohliae TaxID=232270 RepID=UPI00037CF16F|nr:hypothetical protein [Effusibacillus pohliae]